jgi:hypothetical protein
MKIEEIKEGYWKNIDIQNQENKLKPREKFHVMVNGHIWKRDGKPVEFNSRESASKTADTITARYNKATQVVTAKK